MIKMLVECVLKHSLLKPKKLNFDTLLWPNLPNYILKGDKMFIDRYDKKRITEQMKWNIMAMCGDLGLSEFCKKNDLATAVIKHFSYINGYKKLW